MDAQMMKWPLLATTAVVGGYPLVTSDWKWFHYHPLLMMVGFVGLAGWGTLSKKLGGRQNTINHGYAMCGATVSGFLGWYVIYTNKEMAGKPHMVTAHAKVGMAALVGYTVASIAGYLGLHPDVGMMKTNKVVRMVHKNSGRALTAASWVACWLGFATVQKSFEYQAAFAATLVVMAFKVLL
eukprot:TRINITY_DN35392_c0_g1_i1.p2 TRINITY_DN35392_c0_g1~~TRINITY_DN35392_c0_g1_i1.p2  ORF type:complete len:200 (+),score=53.65 TRINITY_DN35392_c0_g1_i1:56-601(+)